MAEADAAPDVQVDQDLLDDVGNEAAALAADVADGAAAADANMIAAGKEAAAEPSDADEPAAKRAKAAVLDDSDAE